MDINNFLQSKSFKTAIIIIGVVALAMLIFGAGMFVGFTKARFSFQWGENYNRNFAGPKGGFMNDFRGRDFIESHGVFGQIIKIDDSTLIIKGRDNIEKNILVNNSTTINRQRENLKISDLKVDDFVIVIGNPNNQGRIEAKLIRVIPPPPEIQRISIPSLTPLLTPSPIN